MNAILKFGAAVWTLALCTAASAQFSSSSSSRGVDVANDVPEPSSLPLVVLGLVGVVAVVRYINRKK